MSRFVLFHKSWLLNFQEFSKPVVKHSHHLKLNVLNVRINKNCVKPKIIVKTPHLLNILDILLLSVLLGLLTLLYPVGRITIWWCSSAHLFQTPHLAVSCWWPDWGHGGSCKMEQIGAFYPQRLPENYLDQLVSYICMLFILPSNCQCFSTRICL